MKRSEFQRLVKEHLNVDMVPEYEFYPGRKWRFDYAIPSHRIALEVEGGVFIGGRHIEKSGYISDMQKYNHAASDGWVLLRVMPSELMTLKTLYLLQKAYRSQSVKSIA